MSARVRVNEMLDRWKKTGQPPDVHELEDAIEDAFYEENEASRDYYTRHRE